MTITYFAGGRMQGSSAFGFADTLGTGADGTNISDPTSVAAGDTNGVAMPSGLGLKSYYFDGNDAINIDGAIGFSASSNTVGSISFWYYNTHDQEGKVILAFGDANATNYMKFPTRYNTTDKILGHNQDTSGNNWEIRNHANDAGDDLADDTWHHMCCVQDGTAVKLYINSILLTVWNGENDKSEWIKSGIDSARIGCDHDTNSTDGNFLTGNVTEVALWNVALTSAQVTSLYNSGNGAKASTIQAGLRAYYDGSVIPAINSAIAVDEKATQTSVPVGTRFEETDTRKIYRSIATASLTDLTWVSEKAIQYSGTDHSQPTGLWFKPDGEEFYVVDEEDNNVTQWSMSTANAWDITNASHTNTLSINSQEATATGIAFSPDGTKMYICGVNGQDTNQYTLSTAWDISGTVTHNGTYSDSGRDNAPYDITMGDSGTKFYILGMQHEKIYQYSLSTANVITSGVTYVTEYDGSSEWSNVTDATFTSDGKKMFVIDQVHDKIFEYALTTAWNVSTASLTGNSSYSSKDNQPHGIQIGNSNTNLFLLGWENDKVHRYTCGATEWVQRGTA